MTWQEYQEAVARLYEQAEGIGTVRRNVNLPDKVTGRPRQVDVLVESQAKGHRLRIIIDAKFRKERLDVKDIEMVLALARAVNANKSVIVAANGWTEPAALKAEAADLDLMLLDLEEALDLVVEDKWEVCPGCEEDCIVLEHEGYLDVDGGYSVFLGGQCRACRIAFIWCWSCGSEGHLEPGSSQQCGCGHTWSATSEGMQVRIGGLAEVSEL